MATKQNHVNARHEWRLAVSSLIRGILLDQAEESPGATEKDKILSGVQDILADSRPQSRVKEQALMHKSNWVRIINAEPLNVPTYEAALMQVCRSYVIKGDNPNFKNAMRLLAQARALTCS